MQHDIESVPWSPSHVDCVTAEDMLNDPHADIQGIHWEHTLNMSREEYHHQRKLAYSNYASMDGSPASNPPRNKMHVDRSLQLVQFNHAYLAHPRPWFPHFQLRHLVHAPSRHAWFYSTAHQIHQLHPVDHHCSIMLDFEFHGSVEQVAYRPLLISSFGVNQDLCFVGGYHGDAALVRLDHLDPDINCTGVNACLKQDQVHYGWVTQHWNGITNHVSLVYGRHGLGVWVCSNDRYVRYLDPETFAAHSTYAATDTGVCKPHRAFYTSWSPNASALCPYGRMLGIVGDDLAAILVDAERGETLMTLTGHEDYSFACAFSPNGHLFATGNQDQTCLVYDLRHTTSWLYRFETDMSAVRSLKFMTNGKYLVCTEAADYVHILELASGLEREQTIELIGEISGTAVVEDSNDIVVGVLDRGIGGGVFHWVDTSYHHHAFLD